MRRRLGVVGHFERRKNRRGAGRIPGKAGFDSQMRWEQKPLRAKGMEPPYVGCYEVHKKGRIDRRCCVRLESRAAPRVSQGRRGFASSVGTVCRPKLKLSELQTRR